MYEKFTDRARKVMQLANSEALRFKHEYVGAEHIFLGLIKEGSGVAAHVLKTFGYDNLPDLRAQIDEFLAPGPEPYTFQSGDILRHAPDAERVVVLAVEEAQNLGDSHVGTEHILLGLLREDNDATHFLADMKLKIEEVRQATLDLLGPSKRQVFGVEQVPCGVCGRPSSPVDCRCDNCWEVEKRLEGYIKSPAGRAHVEALLLPPVAEPLPEPLPVSASASCHTAGGGGQKVYLLHYDEITRPGRCQKIVAVYSHKDTAHGAVMEICSTPENKRAFFDGFGHPQPEDIRPANFWVEEFALLRGGHAILDDWRDADGKYIPDWDYEAVLTEKGVTVSWGHEMVDGEGTVSECPPELCGWGFSWRHGAIHVGQTTEEIARKASALFVSLWTLGVSASFCDKLMDGFIVYLERQENKGLTFLVETRIGDRGLFNGMEITREGMFEKAFLDHMSTQERIIKGLAVSDDEMVLATFFKRKKQNGPQPKKDADAETHS